MSPAELLVWLTTRHAVFAIPRRADTSVAIVEAASSRRFPKYWASVLDVWSALETRNAGADAAGVCPGVPRGHLCRREQGARYCSPWMLLCARVPVGATLREMARLALTMFDESRAACPAFPFGRFVGVGCHPSALVDFRLHIVAREAAQ